MVAVYDSINRLKGVVSNLTQMDRRNILAKGLPSCYSEWHLCEKPCNLTIECERHTIVVDDKKLKRFGF